MKNKITKLLSITTAVLMFTAYAGTASAAIIFQDDVSSDIMSDSLKLGSNDAGASNTYLQFGSDATMSENGILQWNIGTNNFTFDHTVDITGGLSATGAVNFSSASQVRIRENADPNTNSACTTVGEIIVNTTANRIMICTVTGTPGTWVSAGAANADTLDGIESTQFLRSDTSDSFTSGTLTTDALTTLDVNGNFDASGATRFAVASGTNDPLTCTKGDLFFNTTVNTLKACTAANTWTVAGPQDLEAVYSYDADDTLTTSNGNFTVAPGTGTFSVSGTGVLNFDGSSFTLDTTGTFSIDGVGASNVTTNAGNLTLSTTGSGDVAFSSAGDVTMTSADDILFDDAQLTAAIQLTDTATGIAATYGTTGIIDALNSLTLTTAGNGASNVGLQASSLTNVTPASNDVQAALVALDAKVGAGAPMVETLVFYPEYPDTVVFQDGTNNAGTLRSDYDNTNDEHYYNWTTSNGATQDIDLRFRFPMPADFADLNDFTYKYRTGTVTEADNDVEIGVYNATDETAGNPTLCGQDTTNGTAGTWATGTISEATLEAGCTVGTALGAGDIVEVAVKLLDNSGAGDYADIGVVTLGYDN
jgi:hypothetical protein